MLDLLAATAALLVIVVALAVVGLAVTVAPFVVATDGAEARGSSPSRAGALALLGVAVGLLGALLVYRSGAPTALCLLPLVLTWSGAGLALLLPARTSVSGRRGQHER